MYIQFFPIYGLSFGFNYWNSDMDDLEGDEIEHLFQILIGVFGISLHIWKSR